MTKERPDSVELKPGSTFANRFKIVHKIGSGSSADVYLAKDTKLGKLKVAIKLIPADVKQDSRLVQRIARELQIANLINHQNVVKFYEPVHVPQFVGYTMEYVAGVDLRALLIEQIELSPYQVAFLVSQVCAGLIAIHEAGVVHRDLKPENLLLGDDGLVRVTDFGVSARFHGQTPIPADFHDPSKFGAAASDHDITVGRRRLTLQGDVVGTTAYISPEYLQKGQVDQRADIFALGVITYELLTGELPYAGDSVGSLIKSKLQHDPRSPEEVNPKCPQELAEIVMICIKRNRSERFQSAAEVRDELNHFIQHSQPSQEPAIGVQNIVSDYRKGFLPKRNSGPTASKRKWFGSKDHIHKVSTFERVASIPETLASPVTGPLRIILGDSGSIFRRPSTMAFLIPLILLAVIALIIQPYVRDQELEPDQESLHDAAREKASRLLEGSRTIAPDSSKSKSPVIRDFGDTDRYKGRR